jgi:hypothetical protein
MSAPGDLLAVAALQRCMARRDYAGAAQLVTQKATLDGLTALAAPAWRAAAEQAYRESVAAWRADHEASIRRRQERDVRALVALVAEALHEPADIDRLTAPVAELRAA